MMRFLVSAQAEEQLSRWPAYALDLLEELLEDAGSALQREFILRAVAAAHSPEEVHAFADTLRALSDAQGYAACTFEEPTARNASVSEVLSAQADPLRAFLFKGGALSPSQQTREPQTAPIPPAPPRFDIAPASRGARPVALKASPRALVSSFVPFLETMLAQATRELSVAWKEHDIDCPGGLVLTEALRAAAQALQRGLPVPCLIGPKPGEHRRFIVLMQCHPAGTSRAWQLYEPLTAELVWANEGDLLGKIELPLADKINRMLTRVVLPQRFRSSF